MIKQKYLFFILLLFCFNIVGAQNKNKRDTIFKLKKNKEISFFKQAINPYLDYGVSFYSHYLLKPGFEFSVSKNIKNKNKEILYYKKKKSKLSKKNISTWLSINNSYYFHPQNHSGVRLFTSIKRKLSYGNKLSFSYGFTLGVLRSFLGETYEVTDAGEVKELKWYGRFYGTLGALLDISYPVSINNKYNFRPFLSSEIYSVFPYNNFISANFNTQLGVRFYIKKK